MRSRNYPSLCNGLNLHTPPTGPANAAKLEERLEKEGRGQLGETVRKLMRERVKLRTLIQEGLPSERICESARQSDLIVIGKSKPKPFWHLFSRRTVEAVLDNAPCPELVVREQKPNELFENESSTT
jgi:nucleotide-binding universal stress UspA family protein